MKHAKSIGVAVAISAIVTGLSFLSAFDYLECKAYDKRTQITAKNSKPSQDICYIRIDQQSLDWAKETKGWGWPWPRSAYGEIVQYMNVNDAKSVIFDFLYSEASVYGPEDDAAFAASCAEYGRVVQSATIGEDGNEATNVYPISILRDASGAVGNIGAYPDSDGIMRKLPVSVMQNDEEIPFTWSACLKFDGISVDDIKQSTPLQKDGKLYLRYRPSVESYYPYSACDVLQSYYDWKNGDEPLLPPDTFSEAYVYVGVDAPGLFDKCSSPISENYPGTGVLITALDNYLSKDFIRKVPAGFSCLFILFASILSVLFISAADKLRRTSIRGVVTLSSLIIGLILIFAISVIFFMQGWFIQLIAPLVSFAFSHSTLVLVSYMTEGKKSKFIKSAFSQYLSPAVIDKLIENPDRLQLGGEERELSIFFSDVQGFTTISEKLCKNPSVLTEVLNIYLSEMTNIILEKGGTIDKYEGDAIIAFWNAPAEEENHAALVLEAAVACQKRLEEIRKRLYDITGCNFYQRIGMNTGLAVVGNMGSNVRFDYTMLGDSVNLAARLEGLNKQFGTYTMCSKSTMDKALEYGTILKFREIANVRVVGKNEPVKVYEPMTEEDYEKRENILQIFEEGRKLFYDGKFLEAQDVFKKIEDQDPPAKFYLAKTQEYIENPPESWQGVWKTQSK